VPWDIQRETLIRQDPPDYAKRASDAVNLHVLAGSYGKFTAIRLSDGGSDGVAYDTKEDAIRHQLWPEFCFFLFMPPDGLTPHDAWALIDFKRQAFDAGWSFTGEHEVISELRREQFAAAMTQLHDASRG
jgi:hypothetical protein